MKIVGVIPAHLESRRLPRKPLLPICGHPMIRWVYARACKTRELSQLLVATDSDEILEWCRSLAIPVTLTSPAHRSGTERIVEVMHRQSREGAKADIYVNIQSDEPLVEPQHIQALLQPFLENARTEVATLKVLLDPVEASNPSKVKVVTDRAGEALYFSRRLIPYNQNDGSGVRYYKHMGFYAYAATVLERFRSLPPGPLEQAEQLEQLRFLENAISVAVRETVKDTIAVDTAEDLHKVEEHIGREGIRFPEG